MIIEMVFLSTVRFSMLFPEYSYLDCINLAFFFVNGIWKNISKVIGQDNEIKKTTEIKLAKQSN